MIYNFDEIIDRTHNNAAKYDERIKKFGTQDVIPLWIADMDFRVAKPIDVYKRQPLRPGKKASHDRPGNFPCFLRVLLHRAALLYGSHVRMHASCRHFHWRMQGRFFPGQIHRQYRLSAGWSLRFCLLFYPVYRNRRRKYNN